MLGGWEAWRLGGREAIKELISYFLYPVQIFTNELSTGTLVPYPPIFLKAYS
jgi:hypothetical protein